MKKRKKRILTILASLCTLLFCSMQIYAYQNNKNEYVHIHRSGEWSVEKEPTCTEDGLAAHVCLDCHEKYENKLLKKTGHQGEWKITEKPTCIAKGKRCQVCRNCKAVLKEEELPCSEHEYIWTVTKEPTCRSDGLKKLVCKNCGEKKAEKKIKELGHTYTDCVCDRCGFVTSCDKAHHQMFFDEYAVTACGMSLSGDIVIPSEITYEEEQYEIIGVGSTLFYGNSTVTSVTLPDTIKYIGSHAFDHCENLTSCNLPAGLISIGSAAFQCCSSLRHIELPDSLQVIGNFAFNHCSSLDNDSIKIPDSIELLGKFQEAPAHMFYDCGTDTFTEFQMENSGNKNGYCVKDGILYARDGKTLVSIPRGKVFDDGVFVVPDTVENLGELSFSRNKNIHTVVISDNMIITGDATAKEQQSYNNIGNQLSISCYVYADVTKYQVKDSNKNYVSKDGILYTRDIDTVVAIPNKYEGILDIPEGVKTWQKEALWTDIDDFMDLTFNRITEIRIPASMEQIDEEQITAINKLADYYETRIVVSEENSVYGVDSSGHLYLFNAG